MTIHLYDGMNVVRMMLENDVSGRVPRKLLNEMWAKRVDDVAVWVWDGAGGKKRRQEIYPKYKAKRLPQPDGVWETVKLIQEVLSHTSVLQITMPGYEADDVLAYYANGTSNPVLIHSTDRDFSQLAVRPNVKGTWRPVKDLLPEHVRLYKTWVGDPSDNIGGVPGFGKKAWSLADKSALLAYTVGAIPKIESLGPVPPRVRNWLAENHAELRVLWKIVGFYDPAPDMKPEHITVGKPDYLAAHNLLQRFMQ